MRLSREKIVHLSHILADFLEREEKVKLIVPKNDIRLLVFNIINREIKKDTAIDQEVRLKISQTKPDIPEGSPDWEALYYKLYQEASERIRKAR